MSRKKFRDFFESYPGPLVGSILIAFSIFLSELMAFKLIEESHTLNGLVEAAMIAGLLAVFVDPLVKAKAHKDATRDIFHHILGFNFPKPIRNRLWDTVTKTKLYRENNFMHCHVSEEGDFIRFSIAMDYEIVNPTERTEPFQPHLQFEKGEDPTLTRVVCLNDPERFDGASLIESKKEPNSVEYVGDEIYIGPEGRLSFKYEYSVRYPKVLGYMFHVFQYPTLGLNLTINSPDAIRITANSTELQSVGEWRYRQSFMPQDHLDIRWEIKPKLAL